MSSRSEVLLLQPWVEDFYRTDCRTQPIGLAYLAAAIKRSFSDIDIVIVDALAGRARKKLELPEELAYLKRYDIASELPFRLYAGYRRFGISEEGLERLIGLRKPILIGISALFTPYYRETLKLAALCKKIHPAVPIVTGGSHASLHPGTMLSPRTEDGRPLCDYILVGEAEEGICQLLSALRGELDFASIGNLLRANKRNRLRVNLPQVKIETLAYPDFMNLPLRHYRFQGKPMCFLVSSRSCPYHCAFCAIHAVFGRKYRARTPDDILSEIELRYREGYRHIDIEDDNFCFDQTRTLQILERIAALDLPLSFSAMNGLNYHNLDRTLLVALKKAGFSNLNLSLVTTDRRLLAAYNRPHDSEHFAEITRISAQLGLAITAYLILGMPGQDLPCIHDGIKFLAGLSCLIGPSPFYFTPGSPIERKLSEDPTIHLASSGKDRYFSARLTALDLTTDRFDRDDLFFFLYLCTLVNTVKEGIDRGEREDSTHFQPVGAVVRNWRWQFEKGHSEPPFSRRAYSVLADDRLLIRGYRSDRCIVLDFPNCELRPTVIPRPKEDGSVGNRT